MEQIIRKLPLNKKALIKYKHYELVVFRDMEDPFNVYNTVDFKPLNIFKINEVIKIYDTYISLNRTKTELFKIFYDHHKLAEIDKLRYQFLEEDGIHKILESVFYNKDFYKDLIKYIERFIQFQVDNGLFDPENGVIFRTSEFLEHAYKVKIVYDKDLPF